MHIDSPTVDKPAFLPRRLDQSLTRTNLARVFHEVPEYPVLDRPKMNLSAIALHPMRFKIHLDIPINEAVMSSSQSRTFAWLGSMAGKKGD